MNLAHNIGIDDFFFVCRDEFWIVTDVTVERVLFRALFESAPALCSNVNFLRRNWVF